MILFSGWINKWNSKRNWAALVLSKTCHGSVCVCFVVLPRGWDPERLTHVKSETRTCKEREYAHIGNENLQMQARSVRRLGSFPGKPGERYGCQPIERPLGLKI